MLLVKRADSSAPMSKLPSAEDRQRGELLTLLRAVQQLGADRGRYVETLEQRCGRLEKLLQQASSLSTG